MQKNFHAEYTEYRGLLHFDISQVFDCGQCFRFDRDGDDAFSGVAFGSFVRFAQAEPDILRVYSANPEKDAPLWERYLALDCDYAAVQSSLMRAFADDPTMALAIRAGDGIRILRQEPWEALCSFIISQNNNIPRIKKLIAAICREYGAPIETPRGRQYAFPTPQALADAGINALAALKTGFRAKYIYAAAAAVADGTLSLDECALLPTDKAIERLCTLPGVGPKVASCVALFGLGHTDAFPIDVWVKRVLEKYYPRGLDVASLGEYAGLAQQYLFYYERYRASKEGSVRSNA